LIFRHKSRRSSWKLKKSMSHHEQSSLPVFVIPSLCNLELNSNQTKLCVLLNFVSARKLQVHDEHDRKVDRKRANERVGKRDPGHFENERTKEWERETSVTLACLVGSVPGSCAAERISLTHVRVRVRVHVHVRVCVCVCVRACVCVCVCVCVCTYVQSIWGM